MGVWVIMHTYDTQGVAFLLKATFGNTQHVLFTSHLIFITCIVLYYCSNGSVRFSNKACKVQVHPGTSDLLPIPTKPLSTKFPSNSGPSLELDFTQSYFVWRYNRGVHGRQGDHGNPTKYMWCMIISLSMEVSFSILRAHDGGLGPSR